MRFKLSSGELDTTVVHELWHNGDTPGSYETLRVADGDINFGAAATVTRPDPSTTLRVEALFRIGVVLPASLEGKDIAVRWSLRRENFAVASGVLPLHPDYYRASGEIQTLQLPYEVPFVVPSEDLNFIPPGRDEVSYVFEAQAFWDENGDRDWNNNERIDTSPASVHFKVRDTSMGDYLGRQRQRGKQQIILREE